MRFFSKLFLCCAVEWKSFGYSSFVGGNSCEIRGYEFFSYLIASYLRILSIISMVFAEAVRL